MHIRETRLDFRDTDSADVESSDLQFAARIDCDGSSSRFCRIFTRDSPAAGLLNRAPEPIA